MNNKGDKAYDIRSIFEQMELDLIASMRRAFYYHKNEEQKEGFQFEQWQLAKLRSFDEFRKRNKEILGERKAYVENLIQQALTESYKQGETNLINAFERAKKKGEFIGDVGLPKDEITEVVNKLRELQKKTTEQQGFDGVAPNKVIDTEVSLPKTQRTFGDLPKAPAEEQFFGVNEKKLEALINSVKNDIGKAQHSILRKMDDVYRQTIFKSHMYLQNGAKTINQAVDMATMEFLDKGINSIVYKNGARVNIALYVEMCLRTASQRATFLGEGKKRDEWGLHTIVVSAHGNTCPKCAKWQGRVLIDDVFSKGNKDHGDYPLLSEAIKDGLMHPNCRHTLITYFPGVTQLPTIPDSEEAIKVYDAEQKQRAIERKLRKAKREEAGTTDLESQQQAHKKVKDLQKQLRDHLEKNPKLRRNSNREETGPGIKNKSLKKHEEVLKEKALNGKIKEVRDYILSEQPKNIEIGKQGKHILGHNNYIKGRSYLTISLEEAQELANKYAGKGTFKLTRNGDVKNKELISIEKSIGVNISNRTGEITETNRFYIHYSKNGAHIVPTMKGSENN